MSKILVIDDEIDITKILVKRLALAKFKAVSAGDACQGIQLAHKEQPDLIILDLMLPAGGGLMVLKSLRMSAETAAIPVIVLTGMKDEEHKKTVLSEEVDGYIEKPYDWDNLLETINSVIQKRQQS